MLTYDDPRYEKTHIFAYVRMGQPAGSKEISNTCINCLPSNCIIKTIKNMSRVMRKPFL